VTRSMENLSCRIELESFEGPLDLLLYLIKRDEIDIYEIPMAHVADQYCRYIRMAEELDLDIAGEYLVMAATLTRMKSRALLPRHGSAEEEADPGARLRRQLILYRTFREIAEEFRKNEEIWSEVYMSWGERERWSEDAGESIRKDRGCLMDLLKALNDLSREADEPPSQVIRRTTMTTGECISVLANRIPEDSKVDFWEVVGPEPVPEKVVSYFVTVLELVKRGWIKVQQRYPFSDIILERTERWSVDSR